MSSRYKVVDYYDLRPLDWVSGKRQPLEPGEGHVCDRCGAEHAVVYVVEDDVTKKLYSVGSGCAKASFGFDPKDDKQARRIVASKKREAEILVNEQRLAEVAKLARDVAAEVKRLPRPDVVHLGDHPSKYPHYVGQLVRTFQMGEVTADEWQQSHGLSSSGWDDRQALDLLVHRWVDHEVSERIPAEWEHVTVALNPDRPRTSTTTMRDACRSAAWKLL